MMVRLASGWIYTCDVSEDPERRQREVNTVLYMLRCKPGYRVVDFFIIRWKIDPQPGPNTWQRRQWDPYHHRYVDVP